MNRTMSVLRLAVMAGLCAGLTLAGAPTLAAEDAPAEVSQDGLHLTKQTKSRLVYLRPGTTFTQYKRVSILDCAVDFSKDWVRDYNSSQREVSRKIRDADLERAKTSLSASFKKIFTHEVATKGGYQISETAAPDVLVLRPALINIEVNAPDLMSAGRSVTYVQSSGQMTLYLELWDSTTSTILARIMDARADPNTVGQMSTSVSNRAAADRLMHRWARELRQGLDVVTGKGGTP